jgi:hypothetical protein
MPECEHPSHGANSTKDVNGSYTLENAGVRVQGEATTYPYQNREAGL